MKKVRLFILVSFLVMILTSFPLAIYAGGEKEEAPEEEKAVKEAPKEAEAPQEITGDLILYTAANEKVEAAYMEGFKELYPGIKVARVSLPTGSITSRILAEINNPQADVVYSIYGETYLKILKEAGALEPYIPKDVEKIDPQFRDPDGFYVGHLVTSICWGVNKDVIKEKNLPVPRSWEDLTKPIYKGLINVASPAQSGTGMCIYTGLYDLYDGWSFSDKLNKNVFQFNSSGGAAGRQVARGEIAIGVTYDYAVLNLKAEGFPIEVIFPENTLYDFEGGGLIAGAKHPELGKLWLDYMCSKDAMKREAKIVGVVTRTDIEIEGKPKLNELKLYKMKKSYDLEKFADNWLKRYAK